MAISPDGKTLYPMLEGPLTTDPNQQRLSIFEFDLTTKSYTGRKWFYKLEERRLVLWTSSAFAS